MSRDRHAWNGYPADRVLTGRRAATRISHRPITILLAGAIGVAACGGDDRASTTPTDTSSITSAASTSVAAPSTSVTRPVTTVAGSTSTVAGLSMDDFQAAVAAACEPGTAALASLPDGDGSIETTEKRITILEHGRAAAAGLIPLAAPEGLGQQLREVVELGATADRALAGAASLAGTGDVAATEALVSDHLEYAVRQGVQLALMGATCGPIDAERAANADLNVVLQRGASQINAGFGSVWVSEEQGGTVARVDPDSGEVLARIDVGENPLKSQPADGKMWVRARDEYVRIDPATNTVDARLAKADVGPSANRNWALDGTMWICDGRTLHRYDPTTIEPVTSIDIPIDCDYVYATPDLVVVWVYDDDPSLAADPATVMIDPATNEVLATIALPVDVLAPAVFDDRVFFAGHETPTAVVVDRSTWTVASTHDLGRGTGGGGIVSDGESIFVPTDDAPFNDVLVVDADTYEIVETIEPLDVNHVALLDGSLWSTDGTFDVAQRFDR
jgi:streptogramin lyase